MKLTVEDGALYLWRWVGWGRWRFVACYRPRDVVRSGYRAGRGFHRAGR